MLSSGLLAIEEIKTGDKVDEIAVVADKGYYSAKQFKLCSEENIYPIVANPILKSAPDKNYSKDKFTYNIEKDVYICPEGHELYHSKKRANSQSKEERYNNPKACKSCDKISKCTTGTYRTISEPPFQRYSDIVDERTDKNMDIFKKRKCLVEHPFGTIKRGLGFTYFSTRRTESVRVESAMHFFIYNLKRVLQIMGIKEIIQVI